MLALQWRKRLTLTAHARYCRDSNVFHLMKEGTVDNPDQRVTQVRLNCVAFENLLLVAECQQSCHLPAHILLWHQQE